MRVAFLVPSTTFMREEWKSAEDTYLWNILCVSLEDHMPQHQIKLFIGYDYDDVIYSKESERLKFNHFKKFEIEWVEMGKEYKGKVTSIWNKLSEVCIQQDYQYMKILGDDIFIPTDRGWLGYMIKQLKKNNNIGFSAGWSNNDDIPTQFLIHKKHVDIFEFVYPPLIEAWFCDNFMYEIYPNKYRNWNKGYHLLNCGGKPRYIPKDDKKLCDFLLKRYRPRLNRFLQKLNE